MGMQNCKAHNGMYSLPFANIFIVTVSIVRYAEMRLRTRKCGFGLGNAEFEMWECKTVKHTMVCIHFLLLTSLLLQFLLSGMRKCGFGLGNAEFEMWERRTVKHTMVCIHFLLQLC